MRTGKLQDPAGQQVEVVRGIRDQIDGRVRQVHAFFRQRSPTQLLATAAPHSSPWLPTGYMQNFRKAA
jgi:hypothetical protein